MDEIPSREQCIQLLRDVGCSNEVICHCKAVRDIAVRIAQKAGARVDLVEAGALLHDIGRAKTNTIRHAIEGVKIAKKLGLSQEIIDIIERHIGAGISMDVARSLGLPKKEYIPLTLEEKIVCHADNLLDDCTRQPIEKEIEKALLSGHNEYAVRLARLHWELSKLCGMDLNKI
ncbi:MAG: HDIG domain-containing protein [Candidatus Thermoplasmatota archaeon]|nr:HDIG domain-containing protein [Candidatus Thermoplasmatota archaeon]